MISVIIPTFAGWDSQDTHKNLSICLKSLEQIPKYEAILIGNIEVSGTRSILVPDDTTISKKINIGAEEAKYDILVYMRDYNFLYDRWFDGWNGKFDIDIGMNRILNKNGTRYRDWCSFDDEDIRPEIWVQREPWCETLRIAKPAIVPYSYAKTNKMYISGMFWLANKKFMIDNPFNNELKLGEAEDVEFSLRVRNIWNYKMNTFSTTGMTKQKNVILPEFII